MNSRLAANLLRDRRRLHRAAFTLADAVALVLVLVSIASFGVAFAVVLQPVVSP